MPGDLVFLRPWWLLLLPLGVLLAYWITRNPSDSWRRVCDSHLLDDLLVDVKKTSSLLTWCLVMVGWTLATVALSGPAWDREKTELYQNVDATVVVFDLSRSMNSTDSLPSRIERARYRALEIIESMSNRSVGLVAFAGDAHDVTPVSDDVATVAHLIRSLHTDIMPIQGSNASEGLNRAKQLLKRSGYETGTVVLLTDGIDSAAFAEAQQLRNDGYQLSVIGIGTSIGAPVRLADGEYLRDSSGEFIIAAVDQRSLQELAVTGGGKFSLISNEASDFDLAGLQVSRDARESYDSEQIETVQWLDRGAWFLLPLLPMAALLFRKGWLLTVVFICVAFPDDLMAFEWNDLWKRSDQRAASAVISGNFEDPSISSSSQWNGIARYRQNEFDQAAKEFAKASDSVAHYNHGNALAKSGDLLAAVEQYEHALKNDPEFEDAQFNLALVQKLLEHEQMQSDQQEGEQQQQENSQQSDSRNDEVEAMPRGSGSEELQNEDNQQEADERSGQQSLGNSDDSEEEKYDDAKASSEEDVKLQVALEEEQLQVLEQLLRQVEDDPGALLRRKFHYETHSRQRLPTEDQPW